MVGVSERLTVLPRDFESGVCWGAFGALDQFIKATNAEKRLQPALRICVPPNTTRYRLIAAFSQFVKARPDRGPDEFYPVARDALQAAFSCQTRVAPEKP